METFKKVTNEIVKRKEDNSKSDKDLVAVAAVIARRTYRLKS